jgi:hypothetical protein
MMINPSDGEDQSCRLQSRETSFLGQSGPTPVNCGNVTAAKVMIVAVSPTTVTYDDLDRNGRATESVDTFVSAFRRMRR